MSNDILFHFKDTRRMWWIPHYKESFKFKPMASVHINAINLLILHVQYLTPSLAFHGIALTSLDKHIGSRLNFSNGRTSLNSQLEVRNNGQSFSSFLWKAAGLRCHYRGDQVGRLLGPLCALIPFLYAIHQAQWNLVSVTIDQRRPGLCVNGISRKGQK